MRTFVIARRSLTFYWRTNLAVLLSVVAGTAALTGALFVGDSMRHSLRGNALHRLGPVEYALRAPRFFNTELARRVIESPTFDSRFAAVACVIMSPGGATAPSGDLASAIDGAFDSLDDFKGKLQAAAAGQFGSGWGWLCTDGSGGLSCFSTANQDSPHMQGLTPILGVDVWEHAYYLNYQNRRPDYLAAWWNVVNWDEVAGRYAGGQGA